MMGRRSIQARVLLLVAIGMLGPLAMMAWAGFSTQRRYEEQVLSERTLLAEFFAARLDALLSSELEALQSAAGAQDPAAALRELWVRRHALFDAVFYADASQRMIVEEPRTGIVAATALSIDASQPAFTEIVDGRSVAIVPVRTWDGRAVGRIGGVIEPAGARLAALFKGYQVAQGESIDVVDASGRVIASTDARRVLRESEHGAFMADLIRQRKPGTRSDANELVAFAPVTVAHWGVSVRQPHSDALAFLSRNVIAVAGVLLAIALLFAWGASRSVTLPLASLTRAAERLAAGQLDKPIRRLPEDEVGRLGEALERMRVALKESMVRQLLARTLTAQEHERRRVARELHDETSQSLAALLMRLRTALATAPSKELEDAVALAVRTLDDVHRMIVDLRPSVLDDLGLESAISWYADKHLKSRGIAVRCEFADLHGRLPPQHETAVFRVVQEAISNIDRHARAESVLIQASTRDHHLVVEVEDDGAGFDERAFVTPDRAGRGWGLLGMRERVEMLGGRLDIHSAPGKGTHLLVEVPLP